ncbi:MAG: hypothetical protein JW741_28530, partial [Sedimentisphaerales bacterium]|nr:hypothetical protein [Sedimentisphaerales bacterium]
MQDLIKKIGHFFESHVEKIVLVVVGLACAVLFFKYVIFSPNLVTVDGKKLSPGRVDAVILQKAEELKSAIGNAEAPTAPSYTSVLKGRLGADDPLVAGLFDRPLPQGFMGLFQSPLNFISGGTTVIAPIRRTVEGFRKYKLPPRIGDVTDVAINYIRAAAWVPVEEVTPKLGYDKVDVEPNDVDLVTVEAKFDLASLYHQFRAYFDGEEVSRPEWRDPCLAQPVFAAVQLQRRKLDGSAWSDWQDVPRCRAETYAQMFQIVERVEDLPPGGMDVRLMQFKQKPIVMDLLQPSPYQIASAEEDWFPPSFYDQYKDLQRKVDLQERRDERDKNRTDLGRADGRGRTGVGGQTTGAGGRYRSNTAGGAGGNTMYGGRDRRGGRGQTQDGMYGGDATGRRRGTRARGDDTGIYGGDTLYGGVPGATDKPTLDEVYNDFADVLITYRTDLSTVQEPLLFWAFDDSPQPGATYEYRIRLGVFNPVAGTSQLADQDMSKKDQAILWSNFSQITEPVQIPERMYFFAKDVQDPKRSATVEVARYCLGYWRSEDFEVKPGETIGKKLKPKVEDKDRDRGRAGGPGGRITDGLYAGPNATPRGLGVTPGMFDTTNTNEVTLPDMIDYRTGNMLVDLVQ